MLVYTTLSLYFFESLRMVKVYRMPNMILECFFYVLGNVCFVFVYYTITKFDKLGIFLVILDYHGRDSVHDPEKHDPEWTRSQISTRS